MSIFPACIRRPLLHGSLPIALLGAALCAISARAAQSKPAAPASSPAPDVLVLTNGDTLHGKFVSETAGKVTFHTDPLGDLSLSWNKVKELHVNGQFGVLNQAVAVCRKKKHPQFPVGTFDVVDQMVTVHPENVPAPPRSEE